ncbi:FAD-dependent monooxygenase [Petropleomorpha daqingensis]|uniref:2-polyprenyl-6-methoxyphenol hydroxylase-like FAD-dependent oxidoreductase n=1 Tax=Petropleomorpha daqingensis TaxID=2026353 RepID=A0A853CDM1_9ACTN|nr:FAD-dependent monooxygenase [Petropleomorpha daqingensis]NYJ05189.1 2-polyprenyl-6-methoxyphenol hydroxylase-like FAD-dependent oxidoreductase [Petropleomorpha daqingensis]
MTTRSVLISGAGIAGPALASWLTRRGIAVTVVERAPAPRPGGQAVDLRGAARTVAERMGLLSEIRAVSLQQKGIAWVRADGSIAARMPVDAFGGEGIVSEIEVLRGDLADVLHRATAATTEYLFGDSITGLDEDGDGVTVTFEHAPPRRFDLVVGADGSHSVVRALAFGPEAGCTRPLGLYGCWFTAPADLDVDGWFLMHNLPGGRVAAVRPGRLPGELKAGLTFRSEPLDHDRYDVAAQKELVAERFAGGGWAVPQLVAAMREAADFGFDSHAQVQLEAWSRGRVVLVGDAAWSPTPLTGLGTSLALVGAYVLAGELAAGDLPTALRRYEEVLRSYVTTAQKLPPGGVNAFAPTRALDIRLRQASMRLMLRRPFKQLIAAQFDKAGDIELPDYALQPV